MPLTPKYLHVGPAPKKTTLGSLDPLEPDETKKNTNVYNPVFNFDQSFIDAMQTISPLELNQSVPYVSLRTRKPGGEIRDDLNMTFFHRPLDMDTIKAAEHRYAERPTMSLKSLDIKQTNSSGWMNYTMVDLSFKVHSPEALRNPLLFALITPELPLELEYGWNSPNSFLGIENQERLMFQVKSYDISINEIGEIDLKVDGMAFSERLNNTLLGDKGEEIADDETNGKQFDSISRSKARQEKDQAHLDTLKANPNSAPNDTSVVQSRAEGNQSVEKSSRGTLASEFNKDLKKLTAAAEDYEVGNKKKKFKVVRFHDIIHALCNDTFKAMSDLFIGATDFQVIYGQFNAKAGGLKDSSVADFPVHLEKFRKAIKRLRGAGRFSITIKALVDLIIGNFIENEEYMKTLISDTDSKHYVKPDVEFNLTNRGGIIELQILDLKRDIPVTTVDLMNGGNMTTAELEKAALDKNLPIIRLGHAQSFVKKINLSQMTDQAMKAVFINRMHQDRLESERSSVVRSKSQEAKPTDPLHLPLKGTADVLGHTQWKFGRAFYLSAGFFLIDGVYQIIGVHHHLDATDFKTKIDFVYH